MPLAHFSVYWWRTLHQPPSVLRPGPASLPSSILAALGVNLIAFALLYLYFVAKRVRGLARAAEAVS
jgi:heme exporter protein C